MTTDNPSHATSYNTKPDTRQIYGTLRIPHNIKFILSGDSSSLWLPLEQYFIKPKVSSLCSQWPTSCLKGAVQIQVLCFVLLHAMFLLQGVVSTSPNPSISGKHFLHQQPEDMWTHNIMVTMCWCIFSEGSVLHGMHCSRHNNKISKCHGN
jgi:hypothetical protein